MFNSYIRSFSIAGVLLSITHFTLAEMSLSSASTQSSGADIHGVCFPTFDTPATNCEDVITAAEIPVATTDNINAISDGHAADTTLPAPPGNTTGVRYSFQDGAVGINVDIQAEIGADLGGDDIWSITADDTTISPPLLLIQGSPPPDGVAAQNPGHMGLNIANSDVDGYAFDGMALGRFYYTLDATAGSDPAEIFTKADPGAAQTTFATRAALGLANGDVVDAISVGEGSGAVFDGADYVYFSLAPGSTSLGAGGQFNGQSPADIYRKDAGAAPPFRWAEAADLGLAAADNLDALEIGDPGSITLSITMDVTSPEGNFSGTGSATLNPLSGEHNINLILTSLSSQAKGMICADLIFADQFMLVANLPDPFDYTGATVISGTAAVDAGTEGTATSTFTYNNNVLDIDIAMSDLGAATIPPAAYVLDADQVVTSSGAGTLSTSGSFTTDYGAAGTFQSDYTVASMPTLLIEDGSVSGRTTVDLISNTMTASGSASWLSAVNVPALPLLLFVGMGALLAAIGMRIRR